MKKTIYRVNAILFGLVFILVAGNLEAQTYLILPLGNSITEGYDASAPTESERIAYRKELFDLLTSGGYNFDFVGHRNAGYDLFSDADHGGIPGSRAQYVVRLLQDGYDERNGIQITPNNEPYLDVYPADIILLHIGTNDITHGEGSSAIDVENILNEIDSWEKSRGRHVTVFVARIIQRTDDQVKNTTTHELNDNVAAMVAGRGDPGVFMVNIETGAGIDYNTELKVDGIHPTQSAYDKMGQKWYASLDAYLRTIPESPTGLTLSGETPGSINLSWNDNSDNESGFEIERSLTSSGDNFTLVHTTRTEVTSYTDTGLYNNTQYFYRVRAVNANGPSLYTSIESTFTLPEPPADPTDLSANPVNEGSIRLNWTDNSDSETGFRIERSQIPGTGYAEIVITSANATDYADAGLADGTEYFYRVCATYAGSNSGYTNEASAVTFLAAPTGLSANAVDESSISLTWSDRSVSETGYRIERSQSSGSGFAEIGSTTANDTVYLDEGLENETRYYYRVRATNALTNSGYSNEVSSATNLSSPEGLTAIAVDIGSISLSWTDHSESETGFRIERSLSSGTDFTQIALTSADAVAFTDYTLTDGTRYFYRVCAMGTTGNSGYSNEASAVTKLISPSGLSAIEMNEHTIRLTWSDNTNNESGYRIERSRSPGSNFNEIVVSSADAAGYTDTGLMDGTKYFYRVCATNAEIDSDYSKEASAVTALSSPTDLTAIAMGTASIGLHWSDNSNSETGYRIERSQSPESGFTEVSVTTVNATSYADNGLTEKEEYFYRVRATNVDRNSGYSNVASATAGLIEPPQGINTDTLFTFYPNPSNGNIIITIKKENESIKECRISLADFSGKVHYSRKIDLSDVLVKEVFEIQLPASVRNGFYSLSLITGDTSVSEKFVLIR